MSLQQPIEPLRMAASPPQVEDLLVGDDTTLGSFAQCLLGEVRVSQRGYVGHRADRSGYRESLPGLDLALVKTGAVQHQHLWRGCGAAEYANYSQRT